MPDSEHQGEDSNRTGPRLFAVVTQEGDVFVAQCREVDVASQGETVEAAISNLEEALALHFENE